ncbi:MAG: portal protein [Alphaproteobacteria bacterium]
MNKRNEEKFEKLTVKASEAFTNATQMYRVYQLATQMTMPNQDSFFLPRGDRGNAKTIMNLRQLYTNTGVLSAKEFMSFALRYFQLNEKQKIQLGIKSSKNIDLDQNPQIKQFLNVLSDNINEILSDSNINQCAEKLVSNLLLGEAPVSYYWDVREGMKFVSIPLNQIALADSSDSVLREFYRQKEMKVKEIINTWPELVGIKKIDDIDLNDEDCWDKCIKITECLNYNYDTGLWDYTVKTNESILVERNGFDVPPFYSIPWMKKSGSAYAVGQAVMVLAELLSANRTEFLMQYGIAIRVVPAWVADDHAALDPRTLRVAPNAINIKPRDAQISALQAGDMPSITMDWLTAKQIEIQKGMSDNTLLGVGKNASATEIQARTTLMNRAEIFLYHRAVDFYKWVVDATVFEMFRNGIIDNSIITWEEYKEYIDITINGLQPQDTATIQKASGALQFYYSLDESGTLAKIALNLPKLFAGTNEAMRLPTGWANDEETIVGNFEALQQAQLQMQTAQVQEQEAKAQGQQLDNAEKTQELNQDEIYNE